MGVIIFGVVLFCVGLTNLNNPLSFGLAIIGLSIALRGVADLTAHLIVERLNVSRESPDIITRD